MKTYETIDHTADLGIKVYAGDLKQLFLNSAFALFDLMVEETKKAPLIQKGAGKKFIVSKNASSLEEVLVAWLSELLYLFVTEGLIMEKAEFQKLEPRSIQAEISGIIFDPDFYRVKTEIKAVTFHELEAKETEGGYEARVIFDV